MRNRLFTMLWVEGDLNPLAQTSIQSFLDHGHQIQLFTYDVLSNIPTGTIVRDGCEIIPREEMKIWLPHYTKFSDFFRYCFLFKEGGFWLDTDFICISEEVPHEKIYWSQLDHNNVQNGAIALPAGHEIAQMLSFYAHDPRLCTPFKYYYSDLRLELAQKMNTREEAIQKMPLLFNGPPFFQAGINFFKYQHFTRSMVEIYPVPWGVWTWLYDNENLTLEDKLFYNTWAIHCWNDMTGNIPLEELLSRKGLVPTLMRHYFL